MSQRHGLVVGRGGVDGCCCRRLLRERSRVSRMAGIVSHVTMKHVQVNTHLGSTGAVLSAGTSPGMVTVVVAVTVTWTVLGTSLVFGQT